VASTRLPPPRGSGARGFTLIELLIVVSLIVVLATIGLATYHNSVQRGREAVLKEDLFRMRDAIDQHYADKGKYPASLEDLVAAGYLRSIPVDPITQSATTWQTVEAEPDPAKLTADPGISNVKSGAEGQALDGSNFSDW
jgi:general secretion pathway protein G